MSKKEFNYSAGYTVKEVFENFKVSKNDGVRIARELYDEGYTKRAICYAATLAENKLYGFVGDPRFEGIFKNEVRKHAFKRGDPRWGDKRLVL